MKKLHAIAAIVLLMGLSSCLSTIHPIFTEKDLLFDPKLIGNWNLEAKPGEGSIQITKAAPQDLNELPTLRKLQDKVYKVVYNDAQGGVEAAYFGFLLKLGKNYYMDFYPAETPATKTYDDFFRGHYTKMHTAYRINFISGNSFELKQLDETFLKNLIKEKKIRISHELTEDETFVVTAPTEELQQYILKYGDTPEAYYQENTSTYTKIK
jgi:hypothetical protein